jgi:hypothetical protein
MQPLELKAIVAIAVAAGVLFGTPAQAQSLSGIKVGEEISSASKLAARPLLSRSVASHKERRWKLPDGNRLSVAVDPETKRIVYAEKTWSGGANGKPADFPGFVYGQTTLADIRAHAQNNGFAFKEHLIDVRPDGLALFNAYEVEGASGLVVTFVTKLSRKDDERLRTGKANVDLNRAARLDAIILADARYLDTIWGDAKLTHKAYKPIRWEPPRHATLASRQGGRMPPPWRPPAGGGTHRPLSASERLWRACGFVGYSAASASVLADESGAVPRWHALIASCGMCGSSNRGVRFG